MLVGSTLVAFPVGGSSGARRTICEDETDETERRYTYVESSPSEHSVAGTSANRIDVNNAVTQTGDCVENSNRKSQRLLTRNTDKHDVAFEPTNDNSDNNNTKNVPDVALSRRRRNDSTEGVWSGEDEATRCAAQDGGSCAAEDGASCSTRPRRSCTTGEQGGDESTLSRALASHCRLL